jgi:hypothetical protein
MWPALSALHANSNDEAGLAAYRAARHRLSKSLLACDPEALRALAGEQAFHLFIAPVHKDIDLLPEERAFCRALPGLLRRWLGRGEQHTRHLLAAMLYYQPYHLDDRHFRDAMTAPDPLLFPALLRYLLGMSHNYTAVGEGDTHARFTEAALARLAELVDDPAAPERWQLVLDAFDGHYVGDMRTANTSSLKRFFVLERGFQGRLLGRSVRDTDLVPLRAFGGGQGKLRVGLLRVAFGLEFDYLMRPLSLLPPDRYEVHVFAANADGLSAAQARYPNLRAHALMPGDVAASVNVVRRAGIDVLMNGSPLGGEFRVLVSAVLLTRAAPVQVMYCSDIMTSGIPAMDYFIVGDVYQRDGLAAEFTEEVVTCPGVGYYFPRAPVGPVDRDAARVELGIAGGETLYVSSAHLFKITPELMCTWARLLKSSRRARLALTPVAADYMRPFVRRLGKVIDAACREVGVARERVLVLEVQGREAVGRVLAAADVYLDSFPYSGPTSALEALLAGVPVVCLAGRTFRGTFVAGLLRALALDQCVAATEAEYVTLARRLAEGGALRREVRERMREQLPGARFFNPELVAGDLDRVLSRLAPRPARRP